MAAETGFSDEGRPPEDRPPKRFEMGLQFVPRDCWVGVYWSRRVEARMVAPVLAPSDEPQLQDYAVLRVYVCLVPTLPIVLTFRRPVPYTPQEFSYLPPLSVESAIPKAEDVLP